MPDCAFPVLKASQIVAVPVAPTWALFGMAIRTIRIGYVDGGPLV
jgi:hypothetical protein